MILRSSLAQRLAPVAKVPPRFLPAFSFGCPASIRDFLDDRLANKLLGKALKGDQAAIEQLDYIARFNEEFHQSYFRDGKDSGASLHSSPELQRKLQDSINSKRKDLWGSQSRRVQLKENNDYTAIDFQSYRAKPPDEKIMAVVEKARMTRGEIIKATGLKQWVVYARMKVLVEYGLVLTIKKQHHLDSLRFISTKIVS